MKGSLFSFVIPVVLAMLSGMGLGGGGLFVIYLNTFSELPQLHMQAINLIFFIFAAGASLLIHLSRRKIYGRAVLVMTACGVVGSLIGSAAALGIDGDILGDIFGIMLICAGSYSFFRTKNGKNGRSSQDPTDLA